MSTPYFCFETERTCVFECKLPDTLLPSLEIKKPKKYAVVSSYPFLPNSVLRYHLEQQLKEKYGCQAQVKL